MPKLSELKKKWQEQRKEEELDQYEALTLTIIDCADGAANFSCFSMEKRTPVVIPASLENADEIKKKISEGKMLRVTVRKRRWSDRVELIEKVDELNEDEIEVDGEFVVQPSMYGGVILRSDSDVVIVKPGTINYRRLLELLDRGVDVVAAKLSNVVTVTRSGMKKVYGVWFYAPEEEEHSTATVSQDTEIIEIELEEEGGEQQQ